MTEQTARTQKLSMCLVTWHLAIPYFIVLAPIPQKTAPGSRATRLLGRARRCDRLVL
jgi:hypothetical protein